MDTDEDVLRRSLATGSEFEPLVERHAKSLHAYLSRRVPDAADDLLSEVWLAAYAGRKNYQPERGPVRGWLFGIARNVLSAHLRRQQPRQMAAARVETDNWDAVDDRLDASRAAPGLFAAVRDLPRHEKELLLLVALDGLSPTEAATALGIPAATARSRLYRARARIQQHLDDHATHSTRLADTATHSPATARPGATP